MHKEEASSTDMLRRGLYILVALVGVSIAYHPVVIRHNGVRRTVSMGKGFGAGPPLFKYTVHTHTCIHA